MDLEDGCDREIVDKRLKGYTLLELFKVKQKWDPICDDVLALNHVMILCFEQGMPFSSTQYKRVFNRIWSKDLHGMKRDNHKWLKRYIGRKILVFKMDKPHPNSLLGRKLDIYASAIPQIAV